MKNIRFATASLTLSAITLAGLLTGVAALSAQQSAPRATAPAARIARGKYLVSIMGCHDCHSPMKMGPNGPEVDMTGPLSGHPEALKMPPAPQLPPGPWVWTGRRHQHRVRRPMGRQLRRQPHARQGHRPR